MLLYEKKNLQVTFIINLSYQYVSLFLWICSLLVSIIVILTNVLERLADNEASVNQGRQVLNQI
jgi:hypothetical protein